MNKEKFAILFLIITHLAGLIGLNQEVSREFFLFFMPINLLLSFAILLYFHEEWKKGVVLLLVAWGLLGFLLEVIGVKTGFPFGEYVYGYGLGVQLFEVSLIMAINWATMLYCAHVVATRWIENRWLRLAVGALIMTGIDVVIEPMAGPLEMWHWAGGHAPLINYLAWLACSAMLLALGIKFEMKNKLAAGYLIILFLFFAFNNMLI